MNTHPHRFILLPLFAMLTTMPCSYSSPADNPMAQGEAATPVNERPNVLFLFTDDQRADTINALGNPWIETPHIDRLVRSGVAFTNAYIMGGSSPAVCSPSRASLLSGRTLWNLENQGMWGFEISDKYKTMPQVFRENGYVTFATGKNEPGIEGHFNRSFSTGDKILFKGMTRSQYKMPLFSYSPSNDYSPEKCVLHTGKHSAEIYADACIRFLEGQKNNSQPFFAYVAFQTPHDPRQSPQEFRDRYDDKNIPLPESFMPIHPFDNGMLKIRDEKLAPFPRTKAIVQKHIADYYATITHTDAQIGRILESLGKNGKLQNTVIVFSSDNGLAVGRHGLIGKQNVYDHSVHVPLIISGPGITAGQVRKQLCYMYDIYPTLCEKAGLKTPETVQFKSLNKVINHADATHREHLYFAFMSWQRSVRDNQYKLIEYCVNDQRHTQLFDLINDPMEINNLAANPEYAVKLKTLRKLLKQQSVILNDGHTPFEFTHHQGQDFWKIYNSDTKPIHP
ncbi:MAG: sulfatase-like hydrolase/transferase [Verrucomicrobiae bacterium]|nr:sulfatase-like hydrolase/transferase [Verrucomicrobiae bacterium]NNJ42573.1 sulfatase-like hydrolase/transferase [Akkermansiaceae bacterium]